MTIKVNGFDGNPFDQRSIITQQHFFLCLYKLSFSGSYATGGDTLDFTNGGVNSAVPPLAGLPIRIAPSAQGATDSVSEEGGIYQYLPGTLLTNNKLEIYANGGTEYSAGAYNADVLTDVVFLEVYWERK